MVGKPHRDRSPMHLIDVHMTQKNWHERTIKMHGRTFAARKWYKSNFVYSICNTITDFLSFEPKTTKKSQRIKFNFRSKCSPFLRNRFEAITFSCKHRIIYNRNIGCLSPKWENQSNNNSFVVIKIASSNFWNRIWNFEISKFLIKFYSIAHSNFSIFLFHSHKFCNWITIHWF